MISRLRAAKTEDIDALVKLEELSFPEEPWSRQMLLEEIENPHALFCVIEDIAEEGQSGEISAYMISWIIPPYEAQIGSIAVHPEKRRQHLACRLMDALLDTCRTLSVGEVSLEVRVSNEPATALYERYGFVKNGVRKRYYQDGEDAYNMIRTEIIPEQRSDI